jgi:hypothetical protein
MGTKILKTYPARVALEATRPDEAVKQNVTFKDGFVVQQGDVIGIITTGGKARRRSRTAAAGTGFAINSNTGQVVDASVFAPGDVLKTEDGTVIGTVQSVDPSTNPDTVALTGNAAVAVAVDDAVLASDGSQVAQGISDAANDGTDDTPADVFIAGYLVASLLRGLDASAIEELSGAVLLGVFKF